VIIRRLVVPLAFAAVAFYMGHAFAQGTFPAPLPGQTGPVGNASPFPLVNEAACMTGFSPLREEAVQRGKLIKAASDRHATPDEACKLIGNYSQAEISMIKYVVANATKCGIPPQIAEQLKAGHKNTENMQKQVCTVAQQAQGRLPAGPVGDFDHLVPQR
jgi:hypothetical protein